MNKLAPWIARFGIAAIIAEHVGTGRPLWTLTGIIVVAAAKEFWFDEVCDYGPPQTFTDNLEDWIGWSLGGLFGFGFVVGWW